MASLTRIAAVALIVLAMLLGIVAWMVARRPATPPVAKPVASASASFPIVVATRALPAGQPIPRDALRVQALPIHPAGSFSDVAQLANRVPAMTIAADAPVLDAQLSSGVAADVKPGERAVAVRVDEGNAVGNQIRPGNRVDVFFTLKREGAEIDRSQARLLVANARVLVFGNPPAAGAAANANNNAGGNLFGGANGAQPVAPPRTAVLAVPVEDIDSLVLAESAGHLVLALRNPADDDAVDARAFGPRVGVLKTVANAPLAGATLAADGVALDQLAGSGARAPVAQHINVAVKGATARGVEVIRGARVETLAW